MCAVNMKCIWPRRIVRRIDDWELGFGEKNILIHRRTKSCIDALIMLFTRYFDYVFVVFFLCFQNFYSLWP